MQTRYIRRHLLSFSSFLLAAVTLLGWYRSTRFLASYNAETPFGIFQFQSETSMFQAGAKFMQHEHRWSFWKNADPVWGDTMQFVAVAPQIRVDGGLIAVYAPYWQLFTALLGIGTGLYYIERRRIISKMEELEESVSEK